MIEIYLDGSIAIPNENASIKLTTENSFFTKSASYTYEVEFPLSISENRAIFGNIGRMDVSKQSRSLEARLVVDNVQVLSGMAHITSVSETSVKVQLLGEAASYNYGNKMDETYIDELDLGDWLHTTYPDYAGGIKKGNTSGLFNYISSHVGAVGTEEANRVRIEKIFGNEYPWVAYPTRNSSGDLMCNRYTYKETGIGTRQFYLQIRGMEGIRGGERPSEDPPIWSFAVQPYVWIMAEKIAMATGFILSKEDNQLYNNEFFRKIFIANANTYIECNKCLPHWTVNEWWTQIENTFGLVMAVDYDKKAIRLLRRAEFYTMVTEHIDIADVVDEYTSEVDSDTQTDISVNNVGFSDFESGSEDLLSEFIHNNSAVNDEYQDIEALLRWANGIGATQMKEYKDTIFECADGRHFIYAENSGNGSPRFMEVDMFRPRLANPDKQDIEVELKIVPAHFIDSEAYLYGTFDRTASTQTAETPIGSFTVRTLEVPNLSDNEWYQDTGVLDEKIDIENILSGEDEESSEAEDVPDEIYIAIENNANMESISTSVTLTSGETITRTFEHPRSLLRERTVALLNGEARRDDAPYSLSLIPISGQENLAYHTITNNAEIDTTIRHCFKFVANSIPDVSAIFNIRNKRYVCEKIEADISSDGLNRLLTGYFYEITL